MVILSYIGNSELALSQRKTNKMGGGETGKYSAGTDWLAQKAPW